MFYIMKNVILTKIFAIYTLSLILSLQITYSIHQTQKNNVQLLDLSKNYIPYNLAWEYQKRLLQYHMNQQAMSSTPLVGSLLVLQHSPVFTLGTGTQTDSGPFHDKIEDENGSLVVSYDTIKVERAGQATYHGPGQLVLYPILDLNYFKKDINLYLRNLEQIVINTCADYDIKAGRVDGQTGVWIDNNVKISAIGIKLRRWVTMHGISVNVNPNLRLNSIGVMPLFLRVVHSMLRCYSWDYV